MNLFLRFVASRKTKAVCVTLAGVVCVLPACSSRSQFQKGYEKGASDTVKRQYWILQDLQKQSRPSPRTSLYRIPINPDPDAIVKTVPYEIAIPVVQ